MGLGSFFKKATGALMNPTMALNIGSTALSSLGGAYSAKKSAESIKATNAMQMQLAKDQMDFQERMSNTAYRRAMNDMRRAGLNPMLAYQQGGATTPGGAMAKLMDPGSTGMTVGASTANALSTAMQTASNIGLQAEQKDLIKGQTSLTNSQIDKIDQEITESISKVALNDEQSKYFKAQIPKFYQEINLLKEQVSKTKSENVRRDIVAKFFQDNTYMAVALEMGLDYNAAANTVEKILSNFNPIKSIMDKFQTIMNRNKTPDEPTKPNWGKLDGYHQYKK